MASSLAARRLLSRAAAARRLALPLASAPAPAPAVAPRRFSADAGPPPPTQTLPPPPLEPVAEPPPRSEGAGSSSSSSTTAGAGGAYRSSPGAAAGARRQGGAGYKEEQEKILRASLLHPRMGWSESAMVAGARDVGISPAIVGAFPRKEAALVEFFMDDCLQQLMDRIDAGEGELLKNLILSERLSKLVRMRLEMQAPYISKWPQALSIQSQPANVATSLKQRAVLVDEIWHAAGDAGSDIDWYVKRTVLGGIYSTSEVYMLTDNSPEFRDTWTFVNRRIKDALDLQKTFQEAAYLAEAVGAGMGGTMQGVLNKVFQNRGA
ncbi:Ubiquinone biosynthesis protein COQ9, mitochondrial [Dichanthelium oligosanthes]|uniref:Ubiquinone biosynthesis protein n=1 Tax=Dichanthelium oligosanthes TaxID=888268 RepID=A0A1E5VFD6_9POAL|nr:Ubiquinone biosynthesis protein COQ9, mitochondrial [Dichanthelium oligosanthes]